MVLSKIHFYSICLMILLCVSTNSNGQTFRKIRERYYPITLSNSLKSRIISECSNKSKKDIINYSLKTTSSLLSFSIKNEKLGDNKTSTANCVGYAALCSAICNYAFKINGYKCRSKQVVGVYLYR